MSSATRGLTEILAWLRNVAPTAQLSSDSRTIVEGDVFFAYPGDHADGRQQIAYAIQKGARAVIYDPEGFIWDGAWNVPHLAVDELKRNAGPLASAYYDAPDAAMFSVAVTGTNGKTSCTQWLGSAFSRLGQPTVVVGTLGIGLFKRGTNDGFTVTGYTTPEGILLQRALAKARDAGAKAVAIEASSIGLEQGRLNGMHFDVALFTNFTRDHLDYHEDMAAYEAAKVKLFDWPGLQYAVINLDDEMGLRLVDRMKKMQPSTKLIGYTLLGKTIEGVPSLHASEIRTSNVGTTFHLESPFGTSPVKAHVVGQFNVSNLLGIMGVLLAKGITWVEAVGAVEALVAVPGRMQQLGGQDAPLVVIDYAHTPDALEKTLSTLRHIAQERAGQLWCVFGCGGDRDPGKRLQMGVVAQAADHAIVTSDNPRSEDPAAIIAQIVKGMDSTNMHHLEIEDRAAAILWAVKHAAKHDVILLAGKGHETYQEIKGKKLPFLDADHASLALATRLTKMGGM